MPAPAVAANLLEPVDVERVEAAQVPFGRVLLDLVAQSRQLGLAQLARALVVDARVREDGFGRRRADAENVLEGSLDALGVGDLDAGNAGGDDVEGAAAGGSRGGGDGRAGARGEL